jgi:hypothetical protein
MFCLALAYAIATGGRFLKRAAMNARSVLYVDCRGDDRGGRPTRTTPPRAPWRSTSGAQRSQGHRG